MRTTVFIYHENGMKATEIAKKTGVKYNSIHGIIKRYKHQDEGKDLPHAHRRPVLSESDKRLLNRSILRDPKIKAIHLKNQTQVNASVTTIKKFMKTVEHDHHLAKQRPASSDSVVTKQKES